MGEPLGLLKVIIVQGKRLAVRDFKTSDPYVVVKLGNQVILCSGKYAKTRVINSNLNPVWNEELRFSLGEPVGTLNLEVYDKDLLKADDKMGNAFLSLQPLVSAARLTQILAVTSPKERTTAAAAATTLLRKVIPESDNCLGTESTISCINGEVVQHVWLRLNDVESGEIELNLKLITTASTSVS